MSPQLKVLFLLAVLLGLGEPAIRKLPSKKELFTQRNTDISIEEIHERLRRASGNPTYTTASLNDQNNRGIVHYSGNDSEVIFVLTYQLSQGTVTSSNLHISNDYGHSFTKINSRIGVGVTLAPAIHVSPENPKKVFFVDATSSNIYFSNDEGSTFNTRPLSPSTINPRSLRLHPTVETWVLAHDPTNNALYVSRNLGATEFTKIADKVYSISDYQWGVSPYDQDNSVVYYNTDNPSNTNSEVDLYTQRYPYKDATRKEFDPSLGPHDAFLIVDRYIFVQKTINSEITLWVSADRQPFKLAQIPSTFNHQNYFVDSIRSIQALVIIQHTNNQYNLYMSEENGALYYQALSDIKVQTGSGNYVIDLELVESMNYTTYIANQNVRSSSADTSPSVRTLISFDVGANWESLKPPTSSDSECIQPLCSLHLHMSTSEYWRTGVYSQESAPGIIIAHGVTGQYLDNDDDTNLFISTDGGSTWSQTLDSTWGVSVLDHGGLIVAARDYHNTADESRTLMYTCNEGDSWSQLTFTLENVRVYGVITEPGETTTVVSLYGVQANSWVVFTVSFTRIFSTVCGPDDYYDWTPFDENTDTGCLLGASVVIERRKPSHCCLNGETYVRELSYSLCACGEEDFECDYGYKHANGINGPCVQDDDVKLDAVCKNESVSYKHSQGYHKIGGDVCMGGIELSYAPYEAPCCLNKSANGIFTATKTVVVTNPPKTLTTTRTITSASITTVRETSTVYKSTAPPITVTVTVNSGARPNTASSSKGSNDNTTSILLGVVLSVAFLVILALAGIAVVICIVKLVKSPNARGYNRVPITYHRESSPPVAAGPSGGVHNINYDDDDDDEKPLAL